MPESDNQKKKNRREAAQIERTKRRILEILIKKHEVTTKDLAEFDTSTDFGDKEKALRELIKKHEQTMQTITEMLERIFEILTKEHEVTTKDLAEFDTSASFCDKEKALQELMKKHEQIREDIARMLDTSKESTIKERILEDSISKRTLEDSISKYYTKTLCTLGIPIEVHGDTISLRIMEMTERWRNTSVGHRLGDKDKMATAIVLATKVVELLRNNESRIGKIFLGSGTTLYKVAEEILRQPARDDDPRWFYSNSLLVLDAFLFRELPGRHLYLLGNEFASVNGALICKKDLDKLAQLHIDASILGFTCLSEDGFWVDESWEKEQMLTLLRNNRCKLVLIPLEWNKIGVESMHCVEGPGIAPTEVLDCMEDDKTRESGRKYVLVTNPPDGNLSSNPAKRKVIDFWEGKGMTVATA